MFTSKPTKARNLLLFMFSVFLIGCASSKQNRPSKNESQDVRARSLQTFFEEFRSSLKSRNTEKVYQSLSENSIEWLEEMMSSASYESKAFLSQRPFYEILTILNLRIQGKSNPEVLSNTKFVVQKILLDTYAVRKNFTKHTFAGYQVEEDRGQVGLKKAPRVPVFFFVNENQGNQTNWKLDLVESLPLLFLGAEKYARQKHTTPLEQAIYILSNVLNIPITSTDLY